jgi:hypothetical protein
MSENSGQNGKEAQVKRKFMYSTPKAAKFFELEIKVSHDFKFYFTAEHLPAELREDFQGVLMKREYFDSFYELEQKVTEVIGEFEARFVEETKQKVIMYEISYDENHKGHNITFQFEVLQRVEIGKKKGKETHYYKERRRDHGFGPAHKTLDEFNTAQFDEANEMAWTAEREAWFIKMAESVKTLGNQLLQGFGKHAEILARKIDQGTMNQLLLPKGDD